MSDTPSPLPANPSLEQLQKRAKEKLRRLRTAGDTASTLADAQFSLARHHGFDTWAALKHHIESLRPPGIEAFERLAHDLAVAYTTGDESTVRAINANFGTAFPTDFHGSEKMQQWLPTWHASETREADLAVVDARQMVAHAYGFPDWIAFAASLVSPAADPKSAPLFRSSRPPFYQIDWAAGRLSTRGPQTARDWAEIFAIVEDHGITTLEAGGITDEAMQQLAGLECITHLNIGGSKALTDEGAQHLARMPQLVDLEIGGWHTALSDRAFEPLRHLPQLRSLKSCWTQGLTDAGAAHFAPCHLLESVNVMGSNAGDGLIRAMEGKTALRFLETGRAVTDAGIPALHRIPAFRRWLGGDIQLGLLGAAALPNRLTIDGDFTDSGLAHLRGLDGVAALHFFWHSKTFTAAGLQPLRDLPKLAVFGIDGGQCGDDAMRQLAAIPGLRQLQSQGAVAGDAGWQALSHAPLLEYIWGRECPNFSSTGFAALAAAPALRGIAISCKLVDDEALALLPGFPALRQFVPIDVPDAGFRHVGRCENLEALSCMYCRETGDIATGHIAGLRKLRSYYAGMTQITDRSLEILAGIESFEKLEFWQCIALTDAGVAHLARLPKLRELEIYNSPKVSASIRQLFGDSVRVHYSA